MSVQRMFENGKDKHGKPVPVDMDAVCKKEKWIKAYVRTESGCFAFSHVETAHKFAGDVATVTVV